MSELEPLRGKVRKRKFIVCDIESKKDNTQEPGFTRPFMVGVYDGQNYTPFFDRPSRAHWTERYFRHGGCVDLAMRAMLVKQNRGKYIYAHNGGRFDFLFLLPWLMNEGDSVGFRFSLVPIASSIQVLDVWRGEDRWRFLDSYRLIPIGLDKAAKTFGLAGKKEHNLSLHENDGRWVDYNKQDNTELYNVLVKFHDYVENVLCGEVGITAPATAMKLFRRRFLDHPLPRSVETHSFIREGYYGGRVECFRTSGEGLYYYDINSSYPAAMLSTMPAGEATQWEGEPPSRLLDSRIGFVRADIEVPESTHIPVLPIHDENSGKLVFPVGKLRGVWAWDEIQLALSQGAQIERWYDSVWYEPLPIFDQFVRELYQYRDTSRPDYDEGLAAIAKLLLNSSYGKFGMKTFRKKVYRWDDPDIPENATPASSDPESLIWYAETEVDAPYIMPQISARVTSLARMRLWEKMNDAIRLGGDVFYCDTDSIIANVVMPTSPMLGDLKNEIPEHGGRLHGEFLGPKLYLLKSDGFSKVKAKGLEQRTEEMIRRLVNGETIYQQRLEKVGTLAKHNFKRGPRMITVPRRLLEGNSKRTILPDGSTRPLTFDMWQVPYADAAE